MPHGPSDDLGDDASAARNADAANPASRDAERGTETETRRHARTPWSVERGGYGDIADHGTHRISEDHHGYVLAVTIGDVPELNAKANAEFICSAVNCHDELVAALKGVIAIADRKTVEFDRARAALARATGNANG